MTRIPTAASTSWLSGKGLVLALLSTSGLGVALPAFAQDAQTGRSQGSPAAEARDVVVVTAQKREERLQDVPLAVTAVSGESLERQQINDTNNLVAAVPSLSYQQGPNPANTSFRVRGIGTSLFGQGLESSVSVVVDGVVAARQSQSFADLADIQRIEVLRGPQGTLFGRNATAGVVNVITASPTHSFEGRVNVTAAEGDEYRVSGTVSGPLGDELAGRLTAYYNDVRGHVRNRGAGGWENGFESWGVRGKLEWQPTDDLSVLATVEYYENDSDCCQPVAIATTTPALLKLQGEVVAGPDNREVSNDSAGFSYAQQATYSLEANLDLGWASLTSITAYQNYKQDANNEVDGVYNPVPVFVGATGGNNYAKWDVNQGLLHLDQFSQEVRLSSPAGERLSYVVGAYYSYLELDRPFVRRRAYCAAGTSAQVGQPCTPTSGQSLGAFSALQSSHLAAFGQAEYALLDNLKVIGGLRVQQERVSVEGYRFGPLIPGDALFSGQPTANAGTNASDDAVTGKFGLQYALGSDAQVYATYTRGYKGLGLSTEVAADFANQEPILPEHVDAYEVGFKGETDDGRMTLAAALFLADYTNLQVQANRSNPDTGVIQFVQTNAGSSETRGIELESTFQVTDDFSVNFAATYAEATIDIDGLNCPLQFQASAPIIPFGQSTPVGSCYRKQTQNSSGGIITSGPIQDVVGGDLPASPRWRLNLAPNYAFRLNDDWDASLQLNISYQSEQQYAVEQDPLLVQDAYTLVDASVSLDSADDRYSVLLFVRNLFDENFYTSMSHNSLLSSTSNATDLVANISKNSKRYAGVTFSTRF